MTSEGAAEHRANRRAWLLSHPDECRALAALYPDDALFRSRIVMGRMVTNTTDS
jgi:hypothetical protein